MFLLQVFQTAGFVPWFEKLGEKPYDFSHRSLPNESAFRLHWNRSGSFPFAATGLATRGFPLSGTAKL
jgi:hypothetical protein